MDAAKTITPAQKIDSDAKEVAQIILNVQKMVDVFEKEPSPRNNAFCKLKSIADKDKLDQAFIVFSQIEALDNVAEKNKHVSHPNGQSVLNSTYLTKVVETAYREFAENPENPHILAALYTQAKEVSKKAREAHARDGFFGRYGLTSCDLQIEIDRVLRINR